MVKPLKSRSMSKALVGPIRVVRRGTAPCLVSCLIVCLDMVAAACGIATTTVFWTNRYSSNRNDGQLSDCSHCMHCIHMCVCVYMYAMYTVYAVCVCVFGVLTDFAEEMFLKG